MVTAIPDAANRQAVGRLKGGRLGVVISERSGLDKDIGVMVGEGWGVEQVARSRR